MQSQQWKLWQGKIQYIQPEVNVWFTVHHKWLLLVENLEKEKVEWNLEQNIRNVQFLAAA